MKNLSTGIMTLFNVTNSFNTAIGGRLFKQRVPAGTSLPYATFKLSPTQDDTFKDTITDVWILFSLFSGLSSTLEIENMHTYLKALFDDTQFTVTDNQVITMIYKSSELIDVPADVESGSEEIWQYDVDYECTIQAT